MQVRVLPGSLLQTRPWRVAGLRQAMHACRYADHQEISSATPTPYSLKGTWCSGITSAPHAEGPGFKSQCVHDYQMNRPDVSMPSAWQPQSIDATQKTGQALLRGGGMRGGDCLKHRFNSPVDKTRRSVAAATQSTWPRGPMDKASAYGAGDCRFESCRGHCSKQGCGALQVCVRPCMHAGLLIINK